MAKRWHPNIGVRFHFLFLAFVSLSQLASANLLRNGDFQDDWITLLPETKNHHWCYSSEFFNRRDFNPDGWTCKGTWTWENADAPRGGRRVVLKGPDASLVQRVNWVLVNDDRTRSGFPDGGGIPDIKPVRDRNPLRLVRDLTLRIRLKGIDVPEKAGTIEVALCPPGAISGGDPLGTFTPPTFLTSNNIPSGTFDERVIEVKLIADEWLKAAQGAAGKDPKEAAEAAASGVILPGTASVAIRYKGAAGSVELRSAELIAAEAETPNLLANPSFEVNEPRAGYPANWFRPQKYRYFPPGYYYIFNTWHNANAATRGSTIVDSLITHSGTRSLHMIVGSGDETFVASDAIDLKQSEPRLIEVSAWVKTDHLCMLQLDAVNEKGERLDGYNFIHKAPQSIGTNDWRQIRQVFRPRGPIQSIRLMLCARGVNGYTLDDTGTQPQNNVAANVWWDDVRVIESQSTEAELRARGAKPVSDSPGTEASYLSGLEIGDALPGRNALNATINPGPAAGSYSLHFDLLAPSGTKTTFETAAQSIAAGAKLQVTLPYTIDEPCPRAYSEYHGTLSLLLDGKPVGSSTLWLGGWTTPIDLELGALYLRPQNRLMVRMNLGLSPASIASCANVKLDVIRRATGQVLQSTNVPATPAAIVAQRQKIPAELREDFSNLLLTDLNVSGLPVQPFNDPQRNWFVRATILTADGKSLGTSDSPPFCRLAQEPKQLAVQTVSIDRGNRVYVNDQPWMPWGAIYGHVPVYPGPADPGAGKYRDLANLPEWSMYDGYTPASYTRRENDFNCFRSVPDNAAVNPKVLEAVDKAWKEDNLYSSTLFTLSAAADVFSKEELNAKAGGADKLAALLNAAKASPSIVSIAPGIEEAFGTFHAATPAQLLGLKDVVDALRAGSGRPVMVGHGGYWNRFEFEKVPFFDIYDPETEPFYPANLHTDLQPLIAGQAKAIWLRPQMYEDVPYERWRFHAWVELMRGCRGWQFAHGPGDASLFRGLHGEMEYIKAAAYSSEHTGVGAEEYIEHWCGRANGKTYIVAATTHGIPFGRWETGTKTNESAGIPRITDTDAELRTESNGYSLDKPAERGPSIHGIQYLPDARSWSPRETLTVWVRPDAASTPKSLGVLIKADGRWTHLASFGPLDIASLRGSPARAYWCLRALYRHAEGFLGWDDKLVSHAMEYLPERGIDLGALPKPGEWTQLTIPLDKLDATEKLIDGVAFIHDGGRVEWGRVEIDDAKHQKHVVWGDSVGLPADVLRKVRISVIGLQKGSKVKVAFEDREIIADESSFTDDFRGEDLYQRFGSGTAYGDTPVALHVYEIAGP